MQQLNTRTLATFAFCILHFAFAIALTACGSKTSAQTLPDGPPLAVPVAPAHEIAIEQIAEAPPPELPPAPEPAPPTPILTKVPAKPAAPRPETPATTTQPAVAPPPEAQAVRAAPAASAGDERKVRALVQKAGEDLNRVDYKKLSTEGKAQYDQSKRFSDEANQAIKERNLLMAMTLAEKAATLAAELVR